jgi:hypothetical protein
MRTMPIVYICSPLRGDIERNIKKAIGYSRFAYSKGFIPLAPHVIFTTFLDEEIPEERLAGMEMGKKLLTICDELWVFGDKISEGMAAEIKKAKSLGLTVKRFNERCEPLDG